MHTRVLSSTLQALQTRQLQPPTAAAHTDRASAAGAAPPIGATEANDAHQNRERNDFYAPRRSIVEYILGLRSCLKNVTL